MLDQTHYKNDTYDRLRFIRYNSYLQLGYSFQRSSASKFSFTPQLAFQIYDHTQTNKLMVEIKAINLNFRYNKFIWGVNNSGIHVGWQTEKFRLMLSNDIGAVNYFMDRANLYINYMSQINKIKPINNFKDGYRGRGYIGNLSFRYIIKNKNQTKF